MDVYIFLHCDIEQKFTVPSVAEHAMRQWIMNWIEMDRKIYELKSEITKNLCFYLHVLYTAISSLQIMLQFSKAKEAILADYKKEENKSITIRVCTNVKRAGMEGIVLHCTVIGLIIIRSFSTSNFKTSKYCCKSLKALQVI